MSPQDIDFGFDPRALDPDLKTFLRKIHIEKKVRSTKDLTLGNREFDFLIPNVKLCSITFFLYVNLSEKIPASEVCQGYSNKLFRAMF